MYEVICVIVAIYLKDTGSVSGTTWEAYGWERNTGNILSNRSCYQTHSSA